MRFNRILFKELENKSKPQKALIVLGARRVGKTELIKKYLQNIPISEYVLYNGESQMAKDAFSETNIAALKRTVGNRKILVIDEAQAIEKIGLKIKLMIDEIEGIQVIISGSSVFDLNNQLGEPLVGRSHVLQLFTLAQMEIGEFETYPQTIENLEDRLLFGSYPELVNIRDREEKIDYLEGMVNSYLLKDILAFEGIKKSNKILDLLRLVAFQVGNELNIDELANQLKGVSRNTVENYLDLLSKVFVIYKLEGFNRNLRKEVTKQSKWYFYDNGIRNAIIRNYNSINLRQDVGALWENYIITERMKFNSYNKKRANLFFWRTYDKQEIDLVEEHNGNLSAFEIKWNKNKKVKAPGAWKKAYTNSNFEVINPDNYLRFIT